MTRKDKGEKKGDSVKKPPMTDEVSEQPTGGEGMAAGLIKQSIWNKLQGLKGELETQELEDIATSYRKPGGDNELRRTPGGGPVLPYSEEAEADFKADREDDITEALERIGQQIAKAFGAKASENEGLADLFEEIRSLKEKYGRGKFDKLSKNVVDKRDSSQSEEEEIGQGIASPQERPPLDEDFVEAALAIQTKLVPDVTAADIAQLETTIRGAQINPPSNKQAFVDAINRVLDAQNLRLRVEGQTNLARLAVKNGSIAVSMAGPGGTAGFKRPKITVERVSDPYGKLGRNSQLEPD